MSASKKSFPLMGLGTFIGIEHQQIEDPLERTKVVTKTILDALRIGYRHFDLAVSYGNLDAIGTAFKQALMPIKDGGLGINREELWLTMKSDSYSQEAIDGYIDTLGVDYLDTFMLHHPYNDHIFGSELSLQNTWHAVTGLNHVNNFGVSNCYHGHLERLIAVCEKYKLPYPFSNEVESNLLCPNNETIEFCQEHGIQVIAYSPLGYNYASEILTQQEVFGIKNPLLEQAKAIDASPAQTALAWHMARGVAVIPKSTQILHLQNNFESTQFTAMLDQPKLESLASMKLNFMDSLTMTAAQASEHAQTIAWHVTSPKITKPSDKYSPVHLKGPLKAETMTKPAAQELAELTDLQSPFEESLEVLLENLRQEFFKLHHNQHQQDSWQLFRRTGIDLTMSWQDILAHAKGNSPKNANLWFFNKYSGNRTWQVLQQMKVLDEHGAIINKDLSKASEAWGSCIESTSQL